MWINAESSDLCIDKHNICINGMLNSSHHMSLPTYLPTYLPSMFIKLFGVRGEPRSRITTKSGTVQHSTPGLPTDIRLRVVGVMPASNPGCESLVCDLADFKWGCLTFFARFLVCHWSFVQRWPPVSTLIAQQPSMPNSLPWAETLSTRSD